MGGPSFASVLLNSRHGQCLLTTKLGIGAAVPCWRLHKQSAMITAGLRQKGPGIQVDAG